VPWFMPASKSPAYSVPSANLSYRAATAETWCASGREERVCVKCSESSVLHVTVVTDEPDTQTPWPCLKQHTNARKKELAASARDEFQLRAML
jgi:hypothetical protein